VSEATDGVTEVLMQYFRQEAELSAPPSPSGKQLDALRNGMEGGDDSRDYHRSQSADARKVRHADLALLVRDLSRLELDALRLRYWFVETTRRDKDGQPVGHATHHRTVSEADLYVFKDESTPDAPMVVRTLAGDEFVRRAEGLDGAPVDGRAIVRETRACFTRYETIAEEFGRSWLRYPELGPDGLTVRQVRSLIKRAREKVADRIVEKRAAGREQF